MPLSVQCDGAVLHQQRVHGGEALFVEGRNIQAAHLCAQGAGQGSDVQFVGLRNSAHAASPAGSDLNEKSRRQLIRVGSAQGLTWNHEIFDYGHDHVQ